MRRWPASTGTNLSRLAIQRRSADRTSRRLTQSRGPPPRRRQERARMSFNQLDPAIPVHILGKGDGYAFAVIDYGQEPNLCWLSVIYATAETWVDRTSVV